MPVAVLVIVGTPVIVFVSGHTSWWGFVATVAVAVTTVAVQILGRTPARWLIDWAAYRFGRNARAAARMDSASCTDVVTAAGVCGIYAGTKTLVAMIQLAPNLDLPTVIADSTVYTEDTIPLDVVEALLDQYGIALDIDIAFTGRRARTTGEYSLVYDQLIGSRPVVGERLTWLVVRLDLEYNVTSLVRRGPCEVSGPQALASAAHRIANRLREYGLAARVLPASALLDATRALHADIEPSGLRETWQHLVTAHPGRFVTTFAVDWHSLGEQRLEDCWIHNRGRTTMVITLSRRTAGPRALVRFVGPEVVGGVPAYLCPLTGRQSTAYLMTLPTPTPPGRSLTLVRNTQVPPFDLLSEIQVPVGPHGQILGAIGGQKRNILALPLFDAVRHDPRRRTIDLRTGLAVAQQIVLRTMVVGASVTVYSSRPQRWMSTVSAVGDERALRLASDLADDEQDDQRSMTIEVFDQVPVRGTGARATIVIGDSGNIRRRSADLTIEQVGEDSIDIGIPMRTVRVQVIEPRGEARYLESTVDTEASVTGALTSTPPDITPVGG
ncbi:type VII secretion protein EccE [Nocardia sp. NBC_00511]|uniref:type VII secretion protein EccE n=1 Tax=Nocardia sp. NBC_00511 TaxID=2903591 RepID=UPI0030E00020